MTASQQCQRREHQAPHGASSMTMIVDVPKGIQPQTRAEEPELEQARHIREGKQLAANAVPPKCAVLFDDLRRAHWSYFGIPSDINPWFDIRLTHIAAVEPEAVYEVLRASAFLIILSLISVKTWIPAHVFVSQKEKLTYFNPYANELSCECTWSSRYNQWNLVSVRSARTVIRSYP